MFTAGTERISTVGQVENSEKWKISEITETTEKELNKVTVLSTTENKEIYTQKSI